MPRARPQPRSRRNEGAQIEVAEQGRKDSADAHRAHAVTQGIANCQVAGVDATTLTQKVGHRFGALVVDDRRRNVLDAITLTTDYWLDAGFVHGCMIGDSLEDFTECAHLAGLETDQVNPVMQIP